MLLLAGRQMLNAIRRESSRLELPVAWEDAGVHIFSLEQFSVKVLLWGTSAPTETSDSKALRASSRANSLENSRWNCETNRYADDLRRMLPWRWPLRDSVRYQRLCPLMPLLDCSTFAALRPWWFAVRQRKLFKKGLNWREKSLFRASFYLFFNLENKTVLPKQFSEHTMCRPEPQRELLQLSCTVEL